LHRSIHAGHAHVEAPPRDAGRDHSGGHHHPHVAPAVEIVEAVLLEIVPMG